MIYLTIVMILNGIPSEQHYAMQSFTQCWEIAQERIKAIRELHPEVTKVGAGCTIDMAGEPI